MGGSDNHENTIQEFSLEELKQLRNQPKLCNHDRRTFLKWSGILGSQAIIGGGVLNLSVIGQ